MDWLSDPQNWIALVTLTTLEIILGIDNIVVISILSGKLPPHRRQQARTIGLSLALITRILLLLSLSWLIGLTAEAGKEGAGKKPAQAAGQTANSGSSGFWGKLNALHEATTAFLKQLMAILFK